MSERIENGSGQAPTNAGPGRHLQAALKRPLAIAAAAVAVLAAAVIGLGSGGDGDGYRIRAIFDNAAFLIPGEDVKIAGAKVGVVESLDVTPDGKAAIVLRIDKPGFQDFRKDATCAIRLQSVIGEKLIECQPTEPHPEGSPPAPPLPKIPRGQPGAGQHLLPTSHTSTPVDADLIANIQRRPYRERFAIILNELGTGLAGRGDDLRKVLRGANPALAQLDRVLKILAQQNRTLRDLAVNGDQVLREWVKKRKQTADFIVQANTTAQATAERRTDLERNFAKFPEFFRQLKPTMARLGALSDEMTPVISDLGAHGADVSRLLVDLGPFARRATPAFKTLGQAADVGGPALTASQPVLRLLQKFASTSRGLSANLLSLATSLKQTDTIQRAMDVIYFAALASNGFDEFGHYLRTALLPDCPSFATQNDRNCSIKFIPGASSAAAASYPSLGNRLASGQGPSTTARIYSRQSGLAAAHGSTSTPARKSAPVSNDTGGRRTTSKPQRSSGSVHPNEALLNYLLGEGQ